MIHPGRNWLFCLGLFTTSHQLLHKARDLRLCIFLYRCWSILKSELSVHNPSCKVLFWFRLKQYPTGMNAFVCWDELFRKSSSACLARLLPRWFLRRLLLSLKACRCCLDLESFDLGWFVVYSNEINSPKCSALWCEWLVEFGRFQWWDLCGFDFADFCWHLELTRLDLCGWSPRHHQRRSTFCLRPPSVGVCGNN